MEKIVNYKPFEEIEGFSVVEKANDKFLTWDNKQFKIKPNGYLPKSGLCFYDILREKAKNKTVLDLGCGEMGIIGLFAYTNGAINVVASDVDEECILWLNKLISDNKLLNMKAVHSNLFENIYEKFDIILSNPPIMPMENIENLDVHDSGGSDGRFFLKKIIVEASNYLQTNGQLYLSAFDFLGTDKRTNDSSSLKEYALQNGYSNFKVVKRINKYLTSKSVTYQQIPYIEKIYPKYDIKNKKDISYVEFQIIQLSK